MIENVSDFISLLIPVTIVIVALLSTLRSLQKRKQEKILTTSEKYYREW